MIHYEGDGKDMVTFTKFGSCVSSDLFNFIDIGMYKLIHTYTAINIASLSESTNIEISDKDICADNNFWKKMQKFCFKHGEVSSFFEENGSDYFLFDLCDERLPLQKWEIGGGVHKFR